MLMFIDFDRQSWTQNIWMLMFIDFDRQSWRQNIWMLILFIDFDLTCKT